MVLEVETRGYSNDEEAVACILADWPHNDPRLGINEGGVVPDLVVLSDAIVVFLGEIHEPWSVLWLIDHLVVPAKSDLIAETVDVITGEVKLVLGDASVLAVEVSTLQKVTFEEVTFKEATLKEVTLYEIALQEVTLKEIGVDLGASSPGCLVTLGRLVASLAGLVSLAQLLQDWRGHGGPCGAHGLSSGEGVASTTGGLG